MTNGTQTGPTPDPQLQMLFDYTKFHIGLYISLATLILGVLNFYEEGAAGYGFYLTWTLVLLCVAGAFGGLIGSSIPSYTTLSALYEARLQPGVLSFLPPHWGLSGKWCAHLEHTAFWAAIFLAVLGLFLTDKPPEHVGSDLALHH